MRVAEAVSRIIDPDHPLDFDVSSGSEDEAEREEAMPSGGENEGERSGCPDEEEDNRSKHSQLQAGRVHLGISRH